MGEPFHPIQHHLLNMSITAIPFGAWYAHAPEAAIAFSAVMTGTYYTFLIVDKILNWKDRRNEHRNHNVDPE